MKIPALRTSEACFRALSGFRYPPRYLEDVVGGLRMAYYDVAANSKDKQKEVFLCLHGEPTWSYLYRHMIPVLANAGRVVCVDLIGFGRSDKPTSRQDYSYSMHRTALLSAVERLDLQNVTLLVQDWGGILGLTLPLEAPQRYKRLLVMNTMLPMEPESTQMALDLHSADSQSGFANWHKFSQSSEDWNVGDLVNLTCRKELEPDVLAAYNAPFPSAEYQAGVNVFPTLVPFSPTQDGYAQGREALHFWKHHWTGPTFMAMGAKDRVIPPALMKRLASYIRGCPEPMVLPQTGHFVQEQSGEEVARAALEYFDRVERGTSKL